VVFLSGVYVGRVVYSNGSNPTIDELLGIFNFIWVNTTQGVKTPYVEVTLLEEPQKDSYQQHLIVPYLKLIDMIFERKD